MGKLLCHSVGWGGQNTWKNLDEMELIVFALGKG
jgi:hypothetical protein